jgi:hypothetical protein
MADVMRTNSFRIMSSFIHPGQATPCRIADGWSFVFGFALPEGMTNTPKF